jgi:hypothetical protein
LQKSLGLVGTVLGALLTAPGSAGAHHSLSAFDGFHPIELEGTVEEFQFTNPHCYVVMKAKGPDGHVATWMLEGSAASNLERHGWNNHTLKPGDEIRVEISPLTNGGAGGSWDTQAIHFRDGEAVAAGR